MFKKIAFSGLLLASLSSPLLAQQTVTPDTAASSAPAQSGVRMERNRSMALNQLGDPATQAKNMTDYLTQQLALDQATSQRVYDIVLARAQKVDAIRANSDAKRAKKQALKATADEFRTELKSLLTPDQFAKLETLKDRMRPSRGGAGSEDKDQQ